MSHHGTVSILLLLISPGINIIHRIQSNMTVFAANFQSVQFKVPQLKSLFKPWFESEAVLRTRTERQLSLDFSLPQESKEVWDNIWTGTGTVPSHLPRVPSEKYAVLDF